MAKTKYKYNPDSLSFDLIRLSFRERFLRFLAYFIGSVMLAVVYGALFTVLVDSPKEKALRREIDQMTLQYELINREMDKVEAVLSHLQENDDNLYRTIFEAEPIANSLREVGMGGVNRYEELEGYDNSEIVTGTAVRLDKILKKIYVQSKSFDDLIALASEKEEMLRRIPAIMPISNNDLKRTASGWGYRIHPIYKIRKFHWGMDFTAPTGTEIYATGDGTVKRVISSKRGLGLHIEIDHGYGYATTYAHLSRFNVKQGQKVKRGDVIGYVGSTGLSTAPHLHYEVALNGKKVDPANYYFNDLTADEYERMIELAMRSGQSFD
ncbi:MAG: M23 family metallopeptidase [Marinilabiliaceae bacterium]|jgi:murein DD-endopeptidase MepM/ murein hydrolase activator NlpD|nr:M23 family metallopeptidase [Marinilabiliaceae bacterium]